MMPLFTLNFKDKKKTKKLLQIKSVIISPLLAFSSLSIGVVYDIK